VLASIEAGVMRTVTGLADLFDTNHKLAAPAATDHYSLSALRHVERTANRRSRMSAPPSPDRPPAKPRLELAVRAVMRRVLGTVLAVVGLLMICAGALMASLGRSRARLQKPRLLWGAQPIISLVNLSRAMKEGGYPSETVTVDSSPLYARELFDHHLYQQGGNAAVVFVGNQLRAYRFFMRALSRYDVFHYFFDGGILTWTPLSRMELPVLRALGKKLVLLPYGGDAFVYDGIANPLWRQALMIEYASLGDATERIERRVRRSTRYADVVVGSVVHVACLPRWDVLPLTAYPIDARALDPVPPSTIGTVRIAHSANHRGAKGTDFLVAAVDALRGEGYDVELDLIERVPNQEALARMAQADVYVDQLLFGYAMAALEAMALGKVVISGLEDTPDYAVFRRYSYLGECPIVPASPETIADVLRELVARRDGWPQIGLASRAYVERWHSYEAARDLYGSIYRRIWAGEDIDLINLYHPLRRGGVTGFTNVSAR
jgi:glycosyltransferase involved in cell wall biosynthesis